jgi:hypothetical protein
MEIFMLWVLQLKCVSFMSAISFQAKENKWREREMPFRNVNLIKTKISLLAGMC